MVLAASASYIAVPAVLRYAIPEAKPSLYLGLSLGITFRSTSCWAFRCMSGMPKAELHIHIEARSSPS
jgi:hypothetical protein